MSEARTQLRDGLVADRDRLYMTNVHFKRSIDFLVAALPLWVDTLATNAALTAEDAALRIEAKERA